VKKVLITGANSYIGTEFEKWIRGNCGVISVDTIDMKGDAWKEKSFRGYDAIFHVAGLAHADVGKIAEEQKKFYYKINTDLTIECARKAKDDGVRQFIFMSSIIVYGDSGEIGRPRVVTKATPPAPANFYGDSKLKAEEGLRGLETEGFQVVILRPPMIYGKNAKGNYPLLARAAARLPIFPKVQNERSMLYIGNLCKFVSLMILNEERGIFFPQNAEYVNTGNMVKIIAEAHRKKVHLTRLFNPALLLLGRMGGKIGRVVNKAFGNMTYEKNMSEYVENYRIYDFRESVYLTEDKQN